MTPTQPKITFKKSKRHDAVLMELLYCRGDGAVQVRAVVPLENARAELRKLDRETQAAVMGACAGAGGAAPGLAARACVGLAADAADLAEAQLAGIFSRVKRVFRRGGGRRPAPPRRQQRPAPEAPEEQQEGGGEADGQDADNDAAVRASDEQGTSKGADVMGSMGIKTLVKKAVVATVPGAGATLAVAQAARDPKMKNAANKLAQARAGNPKAKAQIKQVRLAARAGDPDAKKAVARLHKANALAKRVQSRKGFYDAGVV